MGNLRVICRDAVNFPQRGNGECPIGCLQLCGQHHELGRIGLQGTHDLFVATARLPHIAWLEELTPNLRLLAIY